MTDKQRLQELAAFHRTEALRYERKALKARASGLGSEYQRYAAFHQLAEQFLSRLASQEGDRGE